MLRLLLLLMLLIPSSLSAQSEENPAVIYVNGSPEEIPIAKIDSLLLGKDTITALSINHGQGEFMPWQVYKFSNLKFLGLGYCDYKHMPVGISKLTQLEYMSIYSTPILNLPWDVIKLKSLETLKIQNISEPHPFHISPFWKYLKVAELEIFNKDVSGFYNLKDNRYIKRVKIVHSINKNPISTLLYLIRLPKLEYLNLYDYRFDGLKIPQKVLDEIKNRKAEIIME